MIEILPVWQPSPTNATHTPFGGAPVPVDVWSLCLPHEAEAQAKMIGTQPPVLQSMIGNAFIDYGDEMRGVFLVGDADLGRFVNQKKALEVAIVKGLFRRPGFDARPEWSGIQKGWVIGWKEAPIPPPSPGRIVAMPQGPRLSAEERVLLEAIHECKSLLQKLLEKSAA